MKRFMLKPLWDALSDFGHNRNPYRITERIGLWKSALAKEMARIPELQEELIQPRLPEGMFYKDFKSEHDIQFALGPRGWKEAQELVRTMMEDEVEIEFKGAPLNLAVLGDGLDKLMLMDDTMPLLREYGLVITPTPDE